MQIEHEIRDFLMSRRARITPAQAGLPYVSGMRRVPGLRREEVAMLAGLSVEYYTRIERGTVGGASESVLDAIARTLQLSADERRHLENLSSNLTPSPRQKRSIGSQPITASVQQVLDSMAVPAVVQNERLDVLAANPLGRALYEPLFSGQLQPNFARFAFLDSRAGDFYVNLDDARELCVAVLRATAGGDPKDQKTTELIDDLSLRSIDFRERWAKHNVHRHLRGRKVINHPIAGLLDVTYNDFALPGDPSVSITTYTADPGTPSADNLTLLDALVAARTRSSALAVLA
ncbi:helix-turn-helix transcriptional regulator [Arthrobacter sp. TWP1-1]|uniref:helix-turn-helix transcriptional regulator n=1 Tax=Arthrobacter sp. TWP1-1 TaxID=2804568 RepID=UPI003CF3E588